MVTSGIAGKAGMAPETACRRLAWQEQGTAQCMDAVDKSFNSRMLRSDFSCIRSKIVAPTASLRWRILLMMGGCTSSTRHNSASFLRFIFSMRVSSSLLGTKLDGSKARARFMASISSNFFCLTFILLLLCSKTWIGGVSRLVRTCTFSYESEVRHCFLDNQAS